MHLGTFVPVNGVLSSLLPALTLQIMAYTVRMGKKLSVGVEGHRIHVFCAGFDITSFRTLWETSTWPAINNRENLMLNEVKTVAKLVVLNWFVYSVHRKQGKDYANLLA